MIRQRIAPRQGWQDIVSSQGLPYHTPDGRPYWDESVCYRFTPEEIDQLEAATNELQRLCLEAAQHVIDRDRWRDLAIPENAIPAIKQSWEAEPPSIYGRFDLSFDGRSAPKLLEYNADTPTALVEAAVVQWYWLQDLYPNRDQFNSIHEKLIAQWREIKPYLIGHGVLHLAGTDDTEDMMTLAYMEDVARQAGVATAPIALPDVGWNPKTGDFRDLGENTINNIFALYPWEWLLGEKDAEVLQSLESRRTLWIEPIWKMIWSNKAFLAILWELFPGHPNLLECYIGGPGRMREYCQKPILSREGSNIRLVTRSGTWETDGDYGEEGYIYQAAAPLPDMGGGKFPVIGSWLVTDQGSCGIGIRESDSPVTDNLSRFVPHYF